MSQQTTNQSEQICQPDNKYIFTNEVDYAVPCEVCKLWCKVYKYRQCQKRFDWHKARGVDLLAQNSQADKLAAYQMGMSNSSGQQKPSSNQSKNPQQKQNNTRHRGR